MNRQAGAASLSRQAYFEIRRSILNGSYPLGSPISRRKIAQSLGMSVVPVSDALQKLEAEGLVESWPRVGTRVRIPTLQDVRGHYVVREGLETQSARLFSQKASPEEREEILRLATQLDELYQQCGRGEMTPEENFHLHERHFRFHMRIAECTGHVALCTAIERNQVLTFNWLYDAAAKRTVFPGNHHGKLAEALVQSEIEKADYAMRQHVVYGAEDLLRALEPVLSPSLIQTATF
jgi:DNA-binding GntR family transcriptional regulator